MIVITEDLSHYVFTNIFLVFGLVRVRFRVRIRVRLG